MIVSEKVCLDVISQLLDSSLVRTLSSLIDITSRKGIYDDCFPARGPIFKQIRGVQRKSLSLLLLFFQVPIAQNNQYTKAAYFVVASSATLQLGKPFL